VTELLFDHLWSSWGQLLSDILARLPGALAAPNTPAPPALLMAFERWLLLLKVSQALSLRAPVLTVFRIQDGIVGGCLTHCMTRSLQHRAGHVCSQVGAV